MRFAIAVIALAGCDVVFGFDDIQPGTPPSVFSSPGPRRDSMGYDFVKTVTVTLAADDPTTEIYFTTDGTAPTLASQHAPTPVTGIDVAATSTLAYFGATAAGAQSDPDSDKYFVDATKKTVAGYHVTDVKLDGMSPVVVVSPGQVLAGATARAQAWVQGSCAVCSAQIVYGVDDTDQGCLFDTVRDDPTGPGVFPGFTHTVTFKVTAPTTPGVHIVRITHSEQNSCAQAMAMNSLVTRPDLSRIGVLIVQ
jgi:chitobiase/beta-hexosaminidase-like protein